jgi:putative transposase
MSTGKKGILSLSKIGDIKIRVHREIVGNIKQIILKKRFGKWYAILNTDGCLNRVCGEKILGIDLGITHYIADSDGNFVLHPHTIDKHAKSLAFAQKVLSRKKKGSKNRQKARLVAAKIHGKILRSRNDFLHKLSDQYVKKCKVIVVEGLCIRPMMLSMRNAKNMADASWGKFLQLLAYKAESAGCKIAKINPGNTTKTCSKCGTKKEMLIWERTYACSNCGLELDRDYNAAINIRNRFMGKELALAREPPATLVGQGGSMKQETTPLKRLAVSDASPFTVVANQGGYVEFGVLGMRIEVRIVILSWVVV